MTTALIMGMGIDGTRLALEATQPTAGADDSRSSGSHPTEFPEQEMLVLEPV